MSVVSKRFIIIEVNAQHDGPRNVPLHSQEAAGYGPHDIWEFEANPRAVYRALEAWGHLGSNLLELTDTEVINTVQRILGDDNG